MGCSKCWLSLGAMLAGLAVACGAFAAHGLDKTFHEKYAGETYAKKLKIAGEERVVSEVPLAQKYLADFKTGAEYQMYHALALILLGLISQDKKCRWFSIAGWAFTAGILGFSGGLYAYTLTSQKWIGMIVVPLGGTLFLVGWGALLVGVRNSQTLVQLETNPPPSAR